MLIIELSWMIRFAILNVNIIIIMENNMTCEILRRFTMNGINKKYIK